MSPDPERWKQIKATFQAAAELQGAAERASYVTRACAGDAVVREGVEALLAAHERAGDFMESPAYERLAGSLADEEAEESGRRLGSYRIVREVGRGGMGLVYEAARDDGEFEQRVAVKLIKRGMDADFVLERFRRERQVLATLEHPYIARLLDGGTTPEGRPYLVMEYVEGPPVDEYCDSRRLGTRARLELFRKVCAAVEYAHQRLVVHRDLKPSNILVTEDGAGSPAPKLLDFGIAKIICPEAGTGGDELTLAGLRPMTPDYASPEQVTGRPITTAADIYSLGVVLYELLTGRRPYRLEGRSPWELERAVVTAEPEPPSVAVTRAEESERLAATHAEAPEGLRRALRGDLDNIVLMAMRKEPERRYQSVGQFSEDVRRYLEGLPVVACEDTLSYRVAKFVRRHTSAVAAGSAFLLVLCAAVVLTSWEAHVARLQRARADAERARAERRFADVRRLANSFLFEFHDAIENLPGSTPARQLLVERATEYLDGLAQEARGDASLQRELAGAYEKLGDVQGRALSANLGRSAAAMESYRKALAVREELVGAGAADDLRALARLDRTVGFKQWELGDTAGAAARVGESIKLLEEMGAARGGVEERLDLASAYTNLGMLLLEEGRRAAAQENIFRGLRLREEVLAADASNERARSGTRASYEWMTEALWQEGDRAAALEYQRRAFEQSRRLIEAEPGNFNYRRELAVDYEREGDHRLQTGDARGALISYRKELAIFDQLAVSDRENASARSDLASAHGKIGGALAELGDWAGAAPYLRRALFAYGEEAAADPDSNWKRLDLLTSYAEAARAAAHLGASEESIEDCRRALALFDRVPPEAESVAHLANRADAYAALGDAYDRMASGGGAGARGREFRTEACRLFGLSTDIWRDLDERGGLAWLYAAKAEAVARHLSGCSATR